MNDQQDPMSPDRSAMPAPGAEGGLRGKIVLGAAWMIGMRIAIRLIGVISTVILARLLAPADFGLVGMATLLWGMVEVLGAFGFEDILIRDQKADRSVYDTVWTLSIIRGLVSFALLGALAVPTAMFFEEPRLVEIVLLLGGVALVGGFTNVGVVNFRKELRFDRDFLFEVYVKLVSFVVTVSIALVLRNYWALAIGIATSAVARQVLSYTMQPFRPRLGLSGWREVMHFSKWLLATNVIWFFNQRSDSFIVGKIAGAVTLGLYTVAYEIATLATAELSAPIRRALLPGYAKVADDMAKLRENYLLGFGIIVMFVAPVAVGLGIVADPLVRLFLGGKWLAAIPLVEILALFGLIQVAYANAGPAFVAIGRPVLNSMVFATNLSLSVPMVIWAMLEWGIEGAAWALVVSSTVSSALSLGLAAHALHFSVLEYPKILWRTVCALIVMIAALNALPVPWPGTTEPALLFAGMMTQVSTGAVVYVAAHLMLWWLAGRPDGPERFALQLGASIRGRLLRRTGA